MARVKAQNKYRRTQCQFTAHSNHLCSLLETWALSPLFFTWFQLSITAIGSDRLWVKIVKTDPNKKVGQNSIHLPRGILRFNSWAGAPLNLSKHYTDFRETFNLHHTTHENFIRQCYFWTFLLWLQGNQRHTSLTIGRALDPRVDISGTWKLRVLHKFVSSQSR